MKSMKFGDFRDNYDIDPGFHDLYIIKNDQVVLYIGISKENIWNRWFATSYSHIQKNYYGQWFGCSTIGRRIVYNMPESDNWIIELWSLDDCKMAFSEQCKAAHWSLDRMPINEFERMMIRQYCPVDNVYHNWTPNNEYKDRYDEWLCG